MDSTRKTKAKETSLSSILVEEPLMSHFCKLMTESSRSRRLQEILILEVKTLITSWSNTVWMNSTKRKESTLKTTPELWDVLEHNVKKQRESWVQPLKQLLKWTLWLNLKTFPWHSLELNSRNFAWQCSRKPFLQCKKSWKTLEWARIRFTMLSWSVDRLEFQKSLSCWKISSTEKNPTDQSTLIKQLLTAQLFKPLS